MKRFLLRVCLFLTLMPLGWAVLFAMAMMNSGVESWFIAKERAGFCQRQKSRGPTPAFPIFRVRSEAAPVIRVLTLIRSSRHEPQFLQFFSIHPHSLPSSKPPSRINARRLASRRLPRDLGQGNRGLSRCVIGLSTEISGTPIGQSYGGYSCQSRPFCLDDYLYYPFRRMLSPAGKNVPEDPNGLYKGQGFVFVRFLLCLTCPWTNQRMSSCLHRLQALLRISDLCDSRGVNLMLINPPQLVEEVFDPSKFVEFNWIDGNEWPGAKNPSNFYDDHHLVGQGAQLYSEWLSLQVAHIQKDP